MLTRKTQIAIVLFFVMAVTMACSAVTQTATQTPVPAAPAATSAPASPAGCPALPAPQLTKSGFVDDVVLAKNTEGDAKNPVGLTNTFAPTDVFHAVAKLTDAPDNTNFKATWYVTDVGPDIACNSTIDTTDISTSGTRNLDFTLTPDSKWPVGTYRVEVFVNGTLEAVKEFSVR